MERAQDARGYYSGRWRMATRYAVRDRAVVEQSERAAANSQLDKTTYYRNEDLTQGRLHLWFKDLVPDFKILGRSEVPEFADWGTFYRTISLDPSIYLHFLQSTCLSLGVSFRRATLDHIHDAFFLAPPQDAGASATMSVADVVVNCTGLLASRLGGVMDEAVIPIRGQLVIVENESRGMFSLSGDATMDEKIGENCYIIDRPAGKSPAPAPKHLVCIGFATSSTNIAKVGAQHSVAHITPPGTTSRTWRLLRKSCSARLRCVPASCQPELEQKSCASSATRLGCDRFEWEARGLSGKCTSTQCTAPSESSIATEQAGLASSRATAWLAKPSGSWARVWCPKHRSSISISFQGGSRVQAREP